VADSLIEHFPCSAWGLRLLIPRVQSGGRTLLAEAFAEAGARVVEVAAYETGCPPGLPSAAVAALESGRLDALTFSSAKTVRHTAALLQSAFGEGWSTLLAPQGKRTRPLAVVSIGPQTSKACQALLGRVDAEAQPHDLDGLVAACVLALSPADPD
jgi:uroporphyrinogen-III synthase